VSLPTTPPNPSQQLPYGKVSHSRVEVEFSGPLPPPNILEGYERSCPGAASSIVQMFEAQSAHRRLMEQRALEGQIEAMRLQFAENRRGQICALLLCLVFVGCGAFCIARGHEWSGSGIAAMGLSGIVATFIRGKDATHSAKPTPEKSAEASKKNKRK